MSDETGTVRRLVVASNRVPPPPVAGAPPSVGGLVSALQPALEEHGGLWFGWSGSAGDVAADPLRRSAPGVDYVTVDLEPSEVEHYYEGFCNRTLWPLMHGLPDYAHTDAGDYEVWRRVNRRFAEQLLPLLAPSDLVWVHDYHLIPMGAALRAAGWTGALGYFHHIPIPDEHDWLRIPGAAEIARDFAAYDLVGLQTERDRARLASYLPSPAPDLATVPIGIDPQRVRALAAQHPGDPFASLRRGRQVVFGLDRLDYTKGVPTRVEAFASLLDADPSLAEAAVLVQWSAPSREAIPEYQAERRAVEAAVDRVRRASPGRDAVDLRIEVIPAATVAAALRDADVCLVTSVADGMNLVAKEFVATQREERPGVLVLTSGCGAAEQLTEAIIVPGGDPYALGRAIRMALAMPRDERVRRWRALRDNVEVDDASAWRERFLSLLLQAEGRTRPDHE